MCVQAPPLELQGVDPALIKPGACGYMTFTFFRYHVQDPVHTGGWQYVSGS